MRLNRRKLVKCFASLAILLSLSILFSSIWLDQSSKNVFYDGPVIFTNRDSITQRSQIGTFMTDHLLNPVLKSFNCEKLFNGDNAEIERANAYFNTIRSLQQFHSRDDENIRSLALNCKEYKKSRGYFDTPLSTEEEIFPIAYNILFYKNPEQFERLLRAIYRPQNQYCIHVDKKTPRDTFESVELLTDCFDNVFIASKLEVVIYASYTRLTADINCMRDHVERGYVWNYLLNMAASEFPIMTNLQIVKILKEFDGANDIHEVFTTLDQERFKKKHFTYIDMRSNKGHIIHTKQTKEDPPHGLTITKGNAYNVFSRAFIEFVLEDGVARDLLGWSADTFTPDEHYWATLNNVYSNPFLKTPGGFKGHPDQKPFYGRYIGWNSPNHTTRCKARHFVHNICVFSFRDLPMLKQRHKLIANKFDIEYDPLVYMCMEEWIQNKTLRREGITNPKLYKKIARHKSL